MTYAQAKKMLLLSKRLRFGDPNHVEAVRVVVLVETVAAQIERLLDAGESVRLNCPSCDGARTDKCLKCRGEGDCPCCGHECDECDGKGKIECARCAGTGRVMVRQPFRIGVIEDYSREEIEELAEKVRDLYAAASI